MSFVVVSLLRVVYWLLVVCHCLCFLLCVVRCVLCVGYCKLLVVSCLVCVAWGGVLFVAFFLMFVVVVVFCSLFVVC